MQRLKFVASNAGYRKDGQGFVHLKGLVKSGAINTTIFTLPAGYRPLEQKIFTCYGSNSGTEDQKRVDVHTDGSVFLQNFASADFLSIDGISFLGEQ